MSEYKYLSIKQIVYGDEYPFSKGQMAFYLLNRDKNGLKTAVRRIGKCLYLRKDLLDSWIESHNEE